jgi:excisionase family DNA binding protein
MPGYLSTIEVAERLGVSAARVRWLIAAGHLPAVKVANRWLVGIEDLERWQRLPERARGGSPADWSSESPRPDAGDLASGRGRALREAARLPAPRWRALGTTPASMSRWEAGLRSPRGEVALRYARLLARWRSEQPTKEQ